MIKDIFSVVFSDVLDLYYGTDVFLCALVIYYGIVGIAILLRPRVFSKAVCDLMQSETQLFVLGVILTFLGAFWVSGHFVWVDLKTSVVSGIGCLILLKGFLFLIGMNRFSDYAVRICSSRYIRYMSVVCFLISGGLLFLMR